VGVDEVWGSGVVEGCVRELPGGVDCADWLALSEPLEPVEVLEGACSGEAVEASGGDWDASASAVAFWPGWSA
jgi:hypothetical protein